MKYFYFVSFALISILIVIVILYKEEIKIIQEQGLDTYYPIQYIPLLKKDIKNTNDVNCFSMCNWSFREYYCSKTDKYNSK